MGAVYVAEQKSTGKLRALKVMHADIIVHADMQRRFEQEAKVGARIRSAHVVEVVAAGVDPDSGLPYLVMELLDGENLHAYLARTGALPLADVYRLFEQLCHGVDAAHAVGVVHRDLKPENIFLARSNQAGASASVVKVLDFGIAKLASEAGTRATAAIGSPLWMAPEQTAPGPVTPAADVWALGLIAYELLTGEHFWRAAAPGGTPIHLLREIAFSPIPAASARGGARIPPGFDDWFARCVAREPGARFQRAGEAWEAMQAFCHPRDIVNPSARTVSVGPEALAETSSAEPAAPARSVRPVQETPLSAAADVARPIVPVAGPPRASPFGFWTKLAPVLLVAAGLLIHRWVSGPVSAPPIPAIPAFSNDVRHASSSQPPPRVVPDEESAPVDERPSPALPDGFSDPWDTARDDKGGRLLPLPDGHQVRLFTRLVSNASNVRDDVVRRAADWSSWHYLRCYEQTFGKAKTLPDGTVTVSYDIENMLPHHTALKATTLSTPLFDGCVVSTLAAQTMNATGASGAGHVVYAFKFVIVD
jgi:serine/threonine-protein kinase